MSLFLLGVLNAQAAGVAEVPAFDLLESELIGSDSFSSITFSSLNSTYGSDYTHLQIRGTLRSARLAAEDDLRIQINGDTGANYANHRLVPTDSQNASSQNYMVYNGMFVASSGTNANSFSSFVLDITDAFSTNKKTTLRIFGGYEGDLTDRLMLGSGLYNSTNAVDSIKLYPAFGNYKTGSRLSLYGLKASA